MYIGIEVNQLMGFALWVGLVIGVGIMCFIYTVVDEIRKRKFVNLLYDEDSKILFRAYFNIAEKKRGNKRKC